MRSVNTTCVCPPGIDVSQLREYVVRPALQRIEPIIPWSRAAENLVIGTGLHESRMRYVDQLTVGPGPAYGFWQMERLTYEDLWKTYVPVIEGLKTKLLDLAGFDELAFPPVTELHGNLFFASTMCRVFYRRISAALPAADDALAQAKYWKRYYNTYVGKGTVEQALPAFEIACAVTGRES
jgi:Mu-like prophage major head subunit gpT